MLKGVAKHQQHSQISDVKRITLPQKLYAKVYTHWLHGRTHILFPNKLLSVILVILLLYMDFCIILSPVLELLLSTFVSLTENFKATITLPVTGCFCMASSALDEL